MNITLPPIIGTPTIVKKITLNDMNDLAFLMENGSSEDICNYLTKFVESSNCVDKFNGLLKVRQLYLNDFFNIEIESKSMKIMLSTWNNALGKIEEIREVVECDDFKAILDYPRDIYHETMSDLLVDCVVGIRVGKTQAISFHPLSIKERRDIFEELPAEMIGMIKDFVYKNSKEYPLMENKLATIEYNPFDNSGFDILRGLFNYYNYDDILDNLFALSKRVPDMSYLNSLSPKDFDTLVRLYRDEVAKMEGSTKLTV